MSSVTFYSYSYQGVHLFTNVNIRLLLYRYLAKYNIAVNNYTRTVLLHKYPKKPAQIPEEAEAWKSSRAIFNLLTKRALRFFQLVRQPLIGYATRGMAVTR